MSEERDKEIARRERHNMAEVLEKGPGLRWSHRTWVVAKDTAVGKVFIGGLGGLGVGEMWVDLRDDHRDDPTFAEAPEVSWAESRGLCGGMRG